MTAQVHMRLRRVIDDSYKIRIGMTLKEACREILRTYPDSSLFVVTDRTVGELYGRRLLRDLKQPAGHLVVIPPGEQHKTQRSKERIDDRLIAGNADRASLIVALGGGVIGDLAGFVAATLFRGISYIQMPTTLLAQVDSSIGGKVGLDHRLGKNLIGAFHQPKAVYIDPATLRTLPDAEFVNGMAEVIKCAAILDKNLFAYLEENSTKLRARNPEALHHIITRCCVLKKSIVQRDEKENGIRMILNFGHTIGHAVESLSHYRISHGNAVAIGMVAEAKMSVGAGLLTAHAFERLRRLIAAYHLPTSVPGRLSLASVIAATGHDKKARGTRIHYTLLEALGRARCGVPLTVSHVRRLLA